MKNKFYKAWGWIKKPPVWLIALICSLTPAIIVTTLMLLTVDYSQSSIEVLVYCLFAISAIFTAYFVYIIICLAPKIKHNVIAFAEKYDFLRMLMNNFGIRTVIFAIVSLTLSIAYGVFNGVIAIISLSVWYGALAAYYILLAFIRGGIIVFHNRKRTGKFREKREIELEIKKARTYRNSGILIIVLVAALSPAVFQMVMYDRVFSYSAVAIYASATYAFYKITMSIVNFVKAKKQDDMTVEAIRNINLADAMVSILALQTALLDTFGGNVNFARFFNSLTGGAVCAATIAIGVVMTVGGTNKIKELRGDCK